MCITEYTREKELYFHKREIEEARKEAVLNTQKETAKNMLLNGISDELILECTGISPDILSEIKNNMN